MSVFRLFLCSFFIFSRALFAMVHNSTPHTAQQPTLALSHIKHLLSPAVIHNTDLLKQQQGSSQLLFTGATEADFKLTIDCMAKEAGYAIRCCSALSIQSVIAAFKKAKHANVPTIIIIDDLASIATEHAIPLYRKLASQKNKRNGNCIAGWMSDTSKLQEDIQNYFNIPLELSLPSEQQRKEFLEKAIPLYLQQQNSIDIDAIAQKTTCWNTANLLTLIQNSAENIRKDTIQTKSLSEHFEAVCKKMQEAKENTHNALLAAASISYTTPHITFEELSGHSPKDLFDIRRTITRKGYHPGILFHGLPGTGKSSLAEAIATDIGWRYVRCDGSSFASSLQDGAVIRFKKAIQAIQETGSPIVLCIDECGALFNKPTHNASSYHEPLLAYLRELTQECNKNKLKVPILIIATTNDIQEIDAALSNRFSAYTYKIQSPPDDIKEEIIAKLMSKTTNDNTVRITRKTLIKQILQHSEGLSIRPLSQVMEKARDLALNNHSKTITDRYFLESLKSVLLELANKETNNQVHQIVSTSLTGDIKREIIHTIGDDFKNNLELKTLAMMVLSLPKVKSMAKYVKSLSPLIWYQNAMHVSKLELEAIPKEIEDAKKDNTVSIKDKEEITSIENNILLLEIKERICQTMAQQNLPQNELLTLFQDSLNQIKTRIGATAYDDLIKRIADYYKNI